MKKKVNVRMSSTHDETAPIRIMDYVGTGKHDFEKIYNSIPTLPNDPVFESKNRRHSAGMYQHLYFTMDEQIKSGEYALYNINNDSKKPSWILFKCDKVKHLEGVGTYYDDYHHIWCEKVVATTDRNLTLDTAVKDPKRLDAVPLIKPDFVEEFCSQHGIDEVMVDFKIISTIPFSKFAPDRDRNYIEVINVDSGNYVTTHLIQKIFTREEVIKLFEVLTYEMAQKILGNRKTEYPYEHNIIPSQWITEKI